MSRATAFLAASFVCGLLVAGSAPLARAQSLEDALIDAYTGNPTLKAEQAKLRQTDELVPQAKAGWRPTAAVESSAGVEWIRRTFHDHLHDTSDHINNPVAANLNVTQPVYQGGSTAAELRQANNSVLAERAQLAVVEEQILLQAITAYVDVVRNAAIVDLTRNNQQVIGEQLKSTNERFDVGEVTKTDVSQAQARLAGAVADVVQAQGNLTASQATYKQVIGSMPGKLTRPPVPTGLPRSADEAVALSEHNPTVEAAIYVKQAARDGTDVVLGELLPSVSLVGSVGIDNDVEGHDVTDKSASISAQAVVPLYQAGSVASRVREQKQLVGQRLDEIDQARRTAVQDASTAWEALDTARAQIKSFKAQVVSNKTALDGVIAEQQVGLRTVLDVLNAQQEVLNAEVSLVGAQHDEIAAAYQVQAAIGKLTSIDLSLPTQPYDVKQHYDEVKDKWWGLNASGQVPGQ